MKSKHAKRNKILSITIPTTLLGLIGIGTGVYFIDNKIYQDNKMQELNAAITKINDLNNKVADKCIKGADVSSYAEIIENLLFEHNIKKSDNTWYTYKDFENKSIKVWDDKLQKNLTLEEYVNHNLYSYFDDNSNLVYDNMFNILKKKGFNSIRLKLFVNPYDDNGKSFGGGHNDLETTIFIINEAKKYGFDDFLIDIMYSDFWADPGKNFMPKEWVDLTDEQLLSKGYSYTFEVLNQIYKQTNISNIRVQYGNEINQGFLWNPKTNERKDPLFLAKFIEQAIRATEDFENEYNSISIDKSLHFACRKTSLFLEQMMQYGENIFQQIDTLQISLHIAYKWTLLNLYDIIKNITDKYYWLDIYLGEISVPYTSAETTNINQTTIANDTGTWTPEIQALVIFQSLQFLSKLFPTNEIGFYWWEIGQIYVGRESWATKAGMESYNNIDYKSWQDINNWTEMTCFDRNGIALPSLDVIKNFERNYEKENVVIVDKLQDYFQFLNNSNSIQSKYFYENINFLWPKNFNKKDLSKLLFDKYNQSAITQQIDIELYLNNKTLNNKQLEELLIQKIKDEYISLMFSQISFSNFVYDDFNKTGEITLVANPDSFYYVSNSQIKLTFKVYDAYLSNTIDLTQQSIEINRNDNLWYKKIISFLKNQKLPNDFGTQIWDYLKITGGASDDDNIWLYDNNKNVNRNAEFFLLSQDKIRLANNKVDSTVLDENKFWIANFQNYSNGENIVYFAIRKGINSIDWENNINSTFYDVGSESWKYIDLLIYKLKINIK